MSADTMVVLSAACIALNTIVLVLVFVMLSGIRQSMRRIEERFSALASRAEDEALATLREVRGAISDARGMVQTGTRVIEKVALASVFGRVSGGGRVSKVLSGAVIGLNLLQWLARPSPGRRGSTRAAGERPADAK